MKRTEPTTHNMPTKYMRVVYDVESDTKEFIVGEMSYALDDNLMQKLYPHQIDGVEWLLCRYHSDIKGGILADDMGLGKTIQMCTMIDLVFKAHSCSRVVVVCPLTLISIWRSELLKWTPSQKFLFIHHNIPRELEEQYLEEFSKETRALMILSYDTLNSRIETILKHLKSLDLLVLDEAHKVKNRDTKTVNTIERIKCKCSFGLTGTPVQNNLTELWCIMNILFQGKVLGEKDHFRSRYSEPIAAGCKREATQQVQQLASLRASELRKIIEPYIIRREKSTVNLTGVSKTELAVWLIMTNSQEEEYKTTIEDANNDFIDGCIDYMNYLTRLKILCCFNRNKELEYGSIKAKFVIRILQLVNKKEKFVIFSQYVSFLNELQQLIKKNGFTVEQLDGNVTSQNRQSVISNFTENKVDCLLVSTQVGAVGITLTAASRVVIVDPHWNPTVDAQSVDRAFRIGQKQNVIVYRLLTCGVSPLYNISGTCQPNNIWLTRTSGLI